MHKLILAFVANVRHKGYYSVLTLHWLSDIVEYVNRISVLDIYSNKENVELKVFNCSETMGSAELTFLIQLFSVHIFFKQNNWFVIL